MIQRAQTLYLLGATALVALCFIFAFAVLTNSSGEMETYTLLAFSKGNYNNFLSTIIAFLSGIVVGAGFTNIFSYKKRKYQMRVCLILIVLIVLIEILAFIFLKHVRNEFGMAISYKLPVALPLISAVLYYLAYTKIKKDEELVKSYDRLR